MRNFCSWISLCAVLALAACTTAGGSIYGPAQPGLSSSIGYSEKELSTGAYQVSFVAPQSTSQADVQNYALRRAAELTLAKGHTWFRLLTSTTQVVQVEAPKQVMQQTTAQMTCNTGNSPQGMGCSYGDQANSIAGVQFGGVTGGVNRLVTTISLVMGDGAKPEGAQVYDAKETAARLSAPKQ